MKKQIVACIMILFLSTAAYAKEEMQPLCGWSFSRWLSDGFQNIMERMEQDFKKLKEEFSKIKLFGPKTTTWYDEKNKLYKVQIELPGYEKDDIEVSVDTTEEKKQILMIRAAKKFVEKDLEGKEITKESKTFKWSETLPADAKGHETTANYKDGILLLEIPVEVKEKTKVVTIKIKNSK